MAREHSIIDGLTARAIAGYADLGYLGAGGAVGTPCRREKGNRHHAQFCAPGERGAASQGLAHLPQGSLLTTA